MRTKSKSTLRDSLDAIVDHVLRGSNDINVVVGPKLCRPSDGKTSRVFYFVVATSEKARGFRCDQITLGEGMEEARAAFILALAQRKPIIIHDVGDELQMARLCETLWPGDRISKIRRQVEAERGLTCVSA
jgi:hypothetical protein